MSNHTVPTPLVERYFDLALSPDHAAYVAQFTDDAVVEDEGREHVGIAAVSAWRGEVPPVTYDVVRDEPTTDGPTTDGRRVDAAVSGDFPGSPVVLRYGFAFAPDGRIRHLTIRPAAG